MALFSVRTNLRAGLLAAALIALGAAPSQAATVFSRAEVDGGGVFVAGDENIDLLFLTTPDASTIRVRASGGTTLVSGSPACQPAGTNTFDCTVTALVAEVSTLEESDIVDVTGAIATTMFGGAGNDVLRGGDAKDLLLGEAGDDQLFGRAGDDDLRGDDGADRIDGEAGSDLAIGGPGADILEDTGGPGTDSVSYKIDAAQTGVRVTVGSGANDGHDEGSEGDDVRNGFERLQGTNYNDVLRGGTAGETINGSAGDDDIEGGGGADTIEGNGGNDIIRAQDGVADVLLDCDALSDPPASNGSADIAIVDATDPDPLRCETVNRPATDGGGGPTGPAAPRNTARPGIVGVVLVGQSVNCSPGTWTENPTFEYAWFITDPAGTTRKAADGARYTPAATDGGKRLACVVVARAAGQSSAASSPLLTVPPRVVAAPPKPVKRDFPDFTAPTKVCGAKGYCEIDEARRKLEDLKFVMTFKAKPFEGLRKIPRSLREKIRPYQVFASTPRPGADDVVSSLEDPVRVSLSYYVPNAERDCPIGETIDVRGGRDYTFNDLLVGLSLREAVKRLKAEKCRESDYEVDYRFRKRSGDPVVAVAKTVDSAGADQVRLTVDHGAPDLQLGFVATAAGEGRNALRLGDTANEITLVTTKRQTSDFTVHVGMRAGGAGFKRLRVELRDPGENLVAIAFTDDQGRARFPQAKISDDGVYELWASHTDAEGDAVVGWKQVTAKPVKTGYTGFDGTTYRLQDGKHVRAAAARASVAGEGTTLTEMRKQALRIRAGLLAFQNSASGQAQVNRLSEAQLFEVFNAYNGLAFFGEGTISLQELTRNFDVRPDVATLGGTQSLGVGPGTSLATDALAVDGREITRQAATGIRVGQGALGFVTKTGAVLFADGSFFLQTAGGNGFRNGIALGATVLDVTRSPVAIDTIGRATFVGVLSDNGLGLVSDNGLGIISRDGAGIISGGGGNIISNDGASIISGGAGNLIGQDGAG